MIRPLLSLGGPRIVSFQTAYDALGSECDPSYTLQGGNSGDTVAQAEAAEIAVYVVAGFTVTVPDYEGENLDWGAGQESGYNTLDAIRATPPTCPPTASRSPARCRASASRRSPPPIPA